MKLLKPDPQPAYVLLAIIFTIFGVMSYRRGFEILGGFLVVAALIVLIRFVRGVIVETQLSKAGVRAECRVTHVEEVKDSKGDSGA